MTIHEIHTFQAICDRCGWHTRELTNEQTIKRFADLHERVCPNPKPPRNGAFMQCGCWWYASPGASTWNTTAECPVHGTTLMVKANTDEPEGVATSLHWTMPPV